MPGGQRICPGGTVFHVLNRGNQRQRLFYSQEDDEALVRVLKETLLIIPKSILAYCLMPNHWHVLVWPERVTTTHTRDDGTKPIRAPVGDTSIKVGSSPFPWKVTNTSTPSADT